MPVTYDSSNIFARILAGDAEAHRVYEDQHALAILDVMPRCDGHTLVLPKASAADFLALPPDAIPGLFAAAQRVARGLMQAFAAAGLIVSQQNGSAAGQSVFHLHIHLMPCRHGQSLKPPAHALADDEVLAEHARRVREALARLAAE